jgi:hypothetical protein
VRGELGWGTHTVGCHSRTVLSFEPEAISGAVGEKATECTGPCVWGADRLRLARAKAAAARAMRGIAAHTWWPANRKARSCGLKFHTMT